MSAMAEQRPQPIGAWSLLAGALAGLRRAWPWALAFAAPLLGIPWLLNYLPIELRLGIVLPHEVALARQAIHLVLASLLGATLLRAMAPGRAEQRLDGAFLEGVCILLLLGVIPIAVGLAVREWFRVDPSEIWKTALAATGLGFAAAFLSMRVFLWPISRLSRGAGLTPVRSWVLTRGTVLSYLLVMAGLFIPFVAVSTAIPMLLGDGGYESFFEVQRTVIQPVFAVVMSLVGLAMSAAVYGRRMGAQPSLGDVFD